MRGLKERNPSVIPQTHLIREKLAVTRVLSITLSFQPKRRNTKDVRMQMRRKGESEKSEAE